MARRRVLFPLHLAIANRLLGSSPHLFIDFVTDILMHFPFEVSQHTPSFEEYSLNFSPGVVLLSRESAKNFSSQYIPYSRIVSENLANENSRSSSNFVEAADVSDNSREVEYSPLIPPETVDQHGISQSSGETCITTSSERIEHRSFSAASSHGSNNDESFLDDGLPSGLLSQSDFPNLHRFFILIILLMVSMFFGICVCLWRLVRETEAGVFVVVEFLDQVFNFGQGILIFAAFGTDAEFIITPLANCDKVTGLDINCIV
ncbi:unnamed protein product [Hydatigera taeniaeformis]|uniref:Na_Ca_ex domain-containing protein n=1 Tax=Hydatigena taeniaeformis TaxID=6205 RepID=A0A158RE43_HYDTA|nr:unnamed protein product [Hydatigera taeniaeformis]